MSIKYVLQGSIRNKSKLYRQWISLKKLLNITYAESVPQTFTKAREIIETMICKLERQFQRDIDAYSKNNLKLFWLHAYSKLKTKNWSGTLLTGQ